MALPGRHGKVEMVNPKSRIHDPTLLNSFAVADTEPSIIESIRKVSYLPIGTLSANNPSIEVLIHPSGRDIFKPKEIMAEIKLRFTAADGTTALTSGDVTDKFVITWMGLYGLFTNQKIFINEQIICDSNGLNLQRSAHQLLTQKSKKQFENELLLAGVHLPSPGKHDSTIAKENANAKAKQALMVDSNTITWTGPIFTPLADPDEEFILPTNTSMRFQWTKASLAQILTCTVADAAKVQMHIDSFKVIVPKIRIDEESALALERTLQSHPCVYKLRKWVSTYITIPPGLSSSVLDGFYSGETPLYTLVSFLTPARLQGGFLIDSACFSDNKLQSLQVCIDEEEEYRQPIRQDEHNVNEPSLALLEGLDLFNKSNQARDLVINRDNFASGFQVYLFNHCSDSKISPDSWMPLKRGHMRFKFQIKDALTGSSIVVLFNMVFQAKMSIHADRTITFHNN